MASKYYSDVKSMAVFSAEGAQPKSLFTEGPVKVLTAGLQAGQKIPVHPEGLAVYTFLEGKGWMEVDGERLAVSPGTTIITPAGSRRGIEAVERLIFLAVRISETAH